ncbi:MAG: tetratricopeptide repeat protein [Balneolaceae bacterium]|nr:tetratricopeptide repeat protein [Balneolaceae bacterium]
MLSFNKYILYPSAMNKSPLLIILFLVSVFFAADLSAQDRLLGQIDFPNSGAQDAQADFTEGVLYLHNFEYEDAARAFRRAQEKDPGFALAYYGEAKTHNHPIWMQQNRTAAMKVLTQLGATIKERQAKAPTQREKDYLYSLEILYGNTPESKDKSKQERDFLYRDYMKQLHEKYPADDEITTFYGLSILGTAHQGRDYAIYMRAAAELFDVWNKNQKHPGAAHYLIHSFDDPAHAPLGLPMAKSYADIAPSAAHAQHMTSHIFLALGMWDDVINANIIARDVQVARQNELKERTTVCGHYTWWLLYGYLQEGAINDAENVLTKCHARVKDGATSSENWHFAIMKAHHITDTQNWKDINQWDTAFSPQINGARNYFFAKGYAAVKSGNIEEARSNLSKLSQTPKEVERDIQIKQLEGLILMEEGHIEEGFKVINEAIHRESELPIDFGPPTIVKPSYELLGDVLLETGKYEEAVDAYQKQLERTPKRRRTMEGIKKAANTQ